MNSLSLVAPAFKAFRVASAAAKRVFDLLEQKSDIDPLSGDGKVAPLDQVHGRIHFENVTFGYDSSVNESSSNLVLKKFDLLIEEGTSVALVGASGCGKSTIANLIQRFYDPLDGTITLDGMKTTDLNALWLRSNIGVVGQSPTLFDMTVSENIALGMGVSVFSDENTGALSYTSYKVDLSRVEECARLANAHEFISQLPQGYNTRLGERGARLSGGQKQRICIARALMRDPKILVLDECTSSLDVASERIVWQALAKASKGRSTIIIAHRLSTVRNVDKIVFLKDGQIVEQGSHSDLSNIEGGHYHHLLSLSAGEEKKENSSSSSEEESSGSDGCSATDSLDEENLKGRDSDLSDHLSDPKSDLVVSKLNKRYSPSHALISTIRINKAEYKYMIAGSIGAFMLGASWLAHGLVVARMIELFLTGADPSSILTWVLYTVGIGVFGMAGTMLQQGALGISGERLSKRLRLLLFEQLIHQSMSFFDSSKNSLGALTTLLSYDAGQVKGLTNVQLGIACNIISFSFLTLFTAFSRCSYISYRMVPIAGTAAFLLGLGNWISSKLEMVSRTDDAATVDTITAETFDNHNIVRALGVELIFKIRLHDALQTSNKAHLKQIVANGLIYGLVELCQAGIIFAGLHFSSTALANGSCSIYDILGISHILMYIVLVLTRLSIFGPEFATARASAKRVYDMLGTTSTDEIRDKSGKAPSEKDKPSVECKNIKFTYPSRPDALILRGMSLDVKQGQSIAIVGPSGHGKSSVLGIIQRLYMAQEGTVHIEELNVLDMNLQFLRDNIGVVSQNAELFDRSVFDNIAYGLPDGAIATTEMVEDACKAAYAHDFLEALPQGYDTKLGRRGDMLSGGQRQRVALGRCLIRQPKLLLLDEATSALDTNSEREVQRAMQQAQAGRTTITVAHRLTSVRLADNIFVVKNGIVVEQGTHNQLLEANGIYADLMRSQLR